MLQKTVRPFLNGLTTTASNLPSSSSTSSTSPSQSSQSYINLKQVKLINQRNYAQAAQRFELTTAAAATTTTTTSSTTSTESDYLPFDKIPTARRLPFFGTKIDLLAAGSLPKLHEFITKRHEKLGPIFREPITNKIDAIFLSSPNLMRSVFLYEGKYPKHPMPESWLLYNEKFQCKRGLFFMDDENWLENRKLMNQLLLRRDTNWIRPSCEIVADKIINKFHEIIKDNNNEITEIPDLQNILYRWSIDVLIHVFLGNSATDENLHLLEPLLNEFSMNVQKIFEYSAKLYILPNKLVKMLNLKVWKEFEESVTITLKLVNQIIDISLDKLNIEDGLLCDMKKQNFSRDDMKQIIADMFIAAGDTTAFSMQWALYLLSRDIKTQTMISNELLNGDLNNTNIYESSNIKGIVKETMRLYPVAPFIGRFFATNAILGCYKIPKDTLVLLSLFTSGRDPQNFSNPNEFIPTRWNREENTTTSTNNKECIFKSHASIPFSMGVRSCIGRKIATTQMHVLLTKILQNFNLKLLNENEVQPIIRMVTVPEENIKISIQSI